MDVSYILDDLNDAQRQAVTSESKKQKLLRSDSFFSGAVCFVRRTLARSAFHGFSIGFQRCKSV